MATFHRMTDEYGRDVVRCFVKGAPDQLLARAAYTLDPATCTRSRSTTASAGGTWTRTSASASRACACMATGRKDFDPAAFEPGATCWPSSKG